MQRPKWVAATEYTTITEDGKVCGRHHHHAIIQHTEGLTRDVLEELWSVNGKRIGLTRGEYLDVDHGSVESLVRYISKNKRCARSWRQSRGLEKPKTPPPNDSKWSRRKLDEASTTLAVSHYQLTTAQNQLQQLLEQLRDREAVIRARTARRYRQSLRILRGNPSATAKAFSEALESLRKLGDRREDGK